MNHKDMNYTNTFNDLTTTILLRLNIQDGSELVSALGYPNTYTNKAAIKRWVIDHYECYAELNRKELLQHMCESIKLQVHEHFGMELFTIH